MQGMKETAANVAASAKAGMEKTKVTMQEKGDKMGAHTAAEKEMAREKKEERMTEAELNKQEAKHHNAAAKQAASVGGGQGHYTTEGTGAYVSGGPGTHTHSATGHTGHPLGSTQQMSAVPGHGSGQPHGGLVEEGVTRTHPSGLPGDTTGHNTRIGGTGYGTGTGTNAPSWP